MHRDRAPAPWTCTLWLAVWKGADRPAISNQTSEQDTFPSQEFYEENEMAMGHRGTRRRWAHLGPCEEGTRGMKLK